MQQQKNHFFFLHYAYMLLLCIITFSDLNAQVISIGPRSVTSNTTITTGTGNVWSNPGNAATSDNNRATFSISSGDLISANLIARGFGFTVPSNSVIVGVLAEIEKVSSDNGNNDYVQDNELFLIGSSDLSTNKISSPPTWNTSEAYVSYGGTSDLWGATLTPAIVNNSNFGIRFNVAAYRGRKTVTASVDHIRITVYYKMDTDLDGVLDETDLDDDNDGIADALEGASTDTDADGYPNRVDLDSDNDGVPDVIESYGVDENGDGRIDNFTDTDNDGLSQNAESNGTNGLGAPDLDGDGVANYVDLDSDNDGIPDILEAGGVDSNNDGMVDSLSDTDKDGWHDAYEGTANALIKSGADNGTDGKADSWPNRNLDMLTLPNPYDLDSDGDGISDYEESGLRTALSGTSSFATIASGTLGADGWSNSVDALASITLRNTDTHGNPDYLDIDSDNDGITDNVEAMATVSYIVSSDSDADGDGLVDTYDSNDGAHGGNALTPFDFDADGIPDYRDTDTDNDSVPDRNEGDRNNKSLLQTTITSSADSDGDGLVDYFDAFDIATATAGSLYKNYSMSNMGTAGTLDGPTPSGSTVGLQRSNPAGDRDWRNVSILPLFVIDFTVTLQHQTAVLNWVAKQEQSVNRYTVERSMDGINFSGISTQPAINSNESKYDYRDVLTAINSKVVYYRIAQLSNDGKLYYTKIIAVQVANGNKAIPVSLYPNPIVTNATLTINVVKAASIPVRILDVTGKQVLMRNIAVQNGNNFITINELSKLKSGVYILQVVQEGQAENIKFIKQ